MTNAQHQGGRSGYGQLSVLSPARALQQLEGMIHASIPPRRQLSRRRQPGRTGVALKQTALQPGLQLLYLPRKWRLRQMQASRRPAKVRFLRRPLEIVRGHGCRVFDAEGAAYLDFITGIGVNALAYGPR